MTEGWNNRKVTILGLGRSGFAAAEYLKGRGADVFVSDSGEVTPENGDLIEKLKSAGVKVETGEHSDTALSFGDLIVTSPGIKPTSDVIKRATAIGKEVICDIELAWRETQIPIIAITGTNGKSTTTALISYMLERTGRSAPACGNFGVPILSQLDNRHDFLVVEISSYQLHYCNRFAPKIAVWLNLTPDHLDWHGGIEQYVQDKNRLFAFQKTDQFAVLNVDDPIVKNAPTQCIQFPFSVEDPLEECTQGAFFREEFLAYRYKLRTHILCRKDELKIIGKHNLENALAAISACALAGLAPQEISRSLREFKALEHRLEFVATINGVAYFNDSKATNPDSAIKALEAFPDQKVVLIAGGRDKGTDLSEFAHSVRKHAAAVILLGEAKERFDKAFREEGVENIHQVGSLNEAIALGGRLNLGPVLLSPACASFDMFKDFEDRGRVFKDIVRSRQVASSV